ncbi:MAG: bifunctional 3-demethylubiquinol 3-O-methyltransferase/2-polyprenyl-6-hydroxyphenol methylase, partial [Gammaproteobacteria bacterium]|nr:bifunctional 3-demethylubiquinol 3-O-methyltransferase/2-polyprenyl-6-hydroxyphenol methylase [Gammaproteobacteria bacterium]
IVGAEYLLRMLPKGTHDYSKFIKPSELESWIRAADLNVRELTGMSYNPLSKRYTLGYDVDVNYLMHCQKPTE